MELESNLIASTRITNSDGMINDIEIRKPDKNHVVVLCYQRHHLYLLKMTCAQWITVVQQIFYAYIPSVPFLFPLHSHRSHTIELIGINEECIDFEWDPLQFIAFPTASLSAQPI